MFVSGLFTFSLNFRMKIPSLEGILVTCWGMGIIVVSTNIPFSAAPAMSYCINPACPAPDKNSPTTNFCMSCGAKILLKDRYRALKLLGQDGFGKTFKAVDEDQPRQPLCVIKQFAFSNNHPETRGWARHVIANLIKNEAISALQSLMELLRDCAASARKSVVEILGELGEPIFIYDLISALSDKEYSVRISAAKALIKFDNEIAIPALINSLTNKDWWVGYYSLQALEKFRARTVVRDALFSIITDLVPSQPEITPEAVHTLKIRSAHALGFYNYEIEKLNIE